FDLAGTAAGLATEEQVFPGSAEVGDVLVGFPSSGIHSNGLTLARQAIQREYDYSDPYPPDTERSIGEALLKPTRIYTYLLDALHEYAVHAAAHVTGGGFTNLKRMGTFTYRVDDPFEPQPIFGFVQELGRVSDAEMHRTFNMGTGFVAAVAPGDADGLLEETDGRTIGRVEAFGDDEEAEESGEGRVEIRGLQL
ncbi:MAG: AIR synthase-related protein, partial [Halodesulfurarchaeum sp.]